VSGAVSPSNEQRAYGRHDHASRRKSQRHGREKGCWVYIPAEQLDKTGYGEDGPPPYYRVWAKSEGRIVIQLYKVGP
jgi:hypothetical protein